MKKRNRVAAILLSVALVASPGCLTILGTADEVKPMAGIKFWLDCTDDEPIGVIFAVLLFPDLPWSFVADLIMLPVTLSMYIIEQCLDEDQE